MIAFNRRTKIFVSKEPSDMRASYDTLFLKTKTILDRDPFSGHLFVFMNAEMEDSIYHGREECFEKCGIML